MGAGRPGQVAALDLAMVHLAIHDAVQAIEKRFDPYHAVIPGAKGSPAAAAAKAAHDVLAKLFPDQAAALAMSYNAYLSAHGIARDDAGVQVGQQAAAAILARRENDGRDPVGVAPFTGGTGAGMWRPTPPQHASMAVPWMSTVKLFALNSPSQFRADPPPQPGQQSVRQGLRRGEGQGRLGQRPHRGADGPRPLLGRQLRRGLEPGAAGSRLRPRQDCWRQRAALRASQCGDGRRRHRRMGQQEALRGTGGPSPPFTRGRTTAIRRRRAIEAGSRSFRRPIILTTPQGPTT